MEEGVSIQGTLFFMLASSQHNRNFALLFCKQ